MRIARGFTVNLVDGGIVLERENEERQIVAVIFV